MIRIYITLLLLLIAPMVAYFLTRFVVTRLKTSTPHPLPRPPYIVLLALGVVLVAIFLTFTSLNSRAGKDAEYIPPRFEDGVLHPAEMKPSPPKETESRP